MPNIAEYENLFVTMGSTDNAVRGNAEEMYNQLRDNAQFNDEFFLAHCQLMAGSQNVAVRSLAAVMFRRLLFQTTDPWPTLAQGTQDVVKQSLIQSIDTEATSSVRHKISDALSELALKLVPENQWEQLLPKMFMWSSSSNPAHRESALNIFAALVRVFIPLLDRYFTVLMDLFHKSLQDQDEKVRIAALIACTTFLVSVKDQRQLFQPLLPHMLAVIGSAIHTQQEESARLALEQFIEIAEEEPKFLRKHLKDIIPGMLSICNNTALQDDTRHLAIEFLIVLCERAPAMMRKHSDFIKAMFPMALKMMTDLGDGSAEEMANWNKGDDDEDLDTTNEETGTQCLDRLALSLGPKHVLPIATEHMTSYIQSPDWRCRHAALMAISVIGEGCYKLMSNLLEGILMMVLRHFEDPHPRVRWAACNAVGMMAADFAGVYFQKNFHHLVIPALIRLMEDSANPRVQAHTAAAIINFCENAHKDYLTPYIEQLLTKLVVLLQHGTKIVQEQAITAIASVADCVESVFSNYYSGIMPLLKQILMNANTKELRIMRGKALECISLIGIAVGKEMFLQDAKQVLDAMIQTQQAPMDADDPQTSYLLQAWARICRVLGRDFIPYLEIALPPLIAAVSQPPDVCIVDADEADANTQLDGYDTLAVGGKIVGIKTSLLEEKATACHMLCCYIEDLRDGFFPYISQVLELLVSLLTFFYNEDVRHAAATAMPDLLQSCVCAMKEGMAQQAHLDELIVKIFPRFIEALAVEMDLEILEVMLEAMDASLKVIGKTALPNQILVALVTTMKVLLNDAMKREAERIDRVHKDEDFDEEENEVQVEEQEMDQYLVAQTCDVFTSLLKFHTDAFLPHFLELLPAFVEMCQPNRKPHDRQISLCMFDDLIDNAPAAATAHFGTIIPLIVNHMLDTTATVRQAAVYGAGAFAQHGGAYFANCARDITAKLIHVARDVNGRSEKMAERATDNAIASLLKIVEYQPGQCDAYALANIVLDYLPIRVDIGEGRILCMSICRMLQANNQALIQSNNNISKIIHGLVSTAAQGVLATDHELTARIATIVKAIPNEMLMQIGGAFPPDIQLHLATILKFQLQ